MNQTLSLQFFSSAVTDKNKLKSDNKFILRSGWRIPGRQSCFSFSQEWNDEIGLKKTAEIYHSYH